MGHAIVAVAAKMHTRLHSWPLIAIYINREQQEAIKTESEPHSYQRKIGQFKRGVDP